MIHRLAVAMMTQRSTKSCITTNAQLVTGVGARDALYAHPALERD
jgi:hypothetical protein